MLAGGSATRFPGKLDAVEGGLTLLERAVRAAGAAADTVVVVLPPGGSAASLPSGVTSVHDEVAGEGPLAGLATGLSVAEGDWVVLVVGGDMPDLHPDVLALLVGALDDSHPLAVLGEPPDDRPRPLPMALRAVAGARAAAELLASGERRLRAMFDVLPVAVVPARDWLALDPDGGSLRDVDLPGDLRDDRRVLE